MSDAHNHISRVIDGASYLHVAWDHHGSPLHYARGKTPGSIELGSQASMVGERSLTYPQFMRMRDGDLVFQCRNGGSGNGQLIMNRFFTKTGQWKRVQEKLIDGEGKRGAY